MNAASEAKQTEFNSKANLLQAAAQTRIGAFQNIGGTLAGIGSSLISKGK